MTITPAQFKTLWASFKGRHPNNTGIARVGGSHARMVVRMKIDGLYNGLYQITPKGMQVLRDACHARWAKHGCMAYQQDLQEVERAMVAK